jgi:hypothetical protein
MDRVLRGANPAELPVQAPTRLKFVIHLKTTQALECSRRCSRARRQVIE